MADSKEFTVHEFLRLVKELNEHEAELKIKLANAGFVERSGAAPEADEPKSAA